MPRVSVLIPAFNAEPYIRSSIQSILDQTWTDFELIVFDDGSTDHTSQIIATYAASDQRVIHQRTSNQGMARTLNAMIDLAKGKLIARLDADDEALPNRLEKQVLFLEDHLECNLVGSAVINIDEEGDPYCIEVFPTQHDDIESRLLSGKGGIVHPSTMIRKSAIVDAGGYSLHFPVVEDQDLWLRIALHGQLANLDEPLTRYRVHARNMSYTGAIAANERLVEVLRHAHQQRGMDSTIAKPRPVYHSVGADERYRHWAWSAVQSRNLKTARKHAWRLLRNHLWEADAWKLLFFAYFPNLADRFHFFLKLFRRASHRFRSQRR